MLPLIGSSATWTLRFAAFPAEGAKIPRINGQIESGEGKKGNRLIVPTRRPMNMTYADRLPQHLSMKCPRQPLARDSLVAVLT